MASSATLAALIATAVAVLNLQAEVERRPGPEVLDELSKAEKNLGELRREVSSLRQRQLELEAIRTQLADLRESSRELGVLRAELASLREVTEERDGQSMLERQAIQHALSELRRQNSPASGQLMALLTRKTPWERQDFIAALTAINETARPPGEDGMITLLPPKDQLEGGNKALVVSEDLPTELNLPNELTSAEAEHQPTDPQPIPIAVRATSPTEPAAAPTGEESPETLAPTPEPEPELAVETGPESEPHPAKNDSPADEITEYTVVRGDSLSRIAQQHSVSVRALAKANRIANPNKIRPGQVLKIPRN